MISGTSKTNRQAWKENMTRHIGNVHSNKKTTFTVCKFQPLLSLCGPIMQSRTKFWQNQSAVEL